MQRFGPRRCRGYRLTRPRGHNAASKGDPMFGRSSALLLTGLCTAAAIALVGATQSSATNQAGHSPTLTPQQSGTTQSLIAVSPVNKRVVWASGRGGTFAVTTDGGATWRSGVVPGAESLQFRDVEGVSDTVAYLLSIGAGTDSRIYKTTDGGATWTQQFQNQDPAAFFDCFAFWTPTRGIAQSDSVNGQFPLVRTTDGQTWKSIAGNEPAALPGESFFASSGTCVATEGKSNAWAVTGGASPSRVLVTRDGGDTWNAYDSPLRGSPSAGLFSVAFRDVQHGMVGGGDLDPAAPPFDQTATSSDGGKTWTVTPQQPDIGTVFGLSYAADAGKARPHGRTVVVTGPGGAAWTPDEGGSWFTLPGVTNFWGVAFGSPQTAWLVGTEGRILRVDF